MGKPFLKGYVDLAEGEKDPRNLMYLFTMDRVILIEWELDAELAEAFYDITYCYFPITFKPPPDDPYGITTDNLKTALRRCLTANPSLAPHAMPLLLEKLAASGGNTKRDTLQTLEEAMPVFGKAAVLANEKRLWEGFKVEIMAATDEETPIYAQRALASFLRTLYSDVEAPEGIASRIIADAMNELEEPEKSNAKPACDLLISMVKACPSTAFVATIALLDQTLTMFKDPEVISIRAPILGHIATLLKALRDVYQAPRDDEKDGKASTSTAAPTYKFTAPTSRTEAEPRTQGVDTAEKDVEMTAVRTYDGDRRPLDAMRDELLAALSNGIRSSGYRSSALLAFVHLTHIPTFLSPAETNYMAESVNELIISPSAEDVRGAALDGLRDIARVNPRVLEETTLPMLFGRLPDRMPEPAKDSTPSSDGRGVVRRTLGALARLCAQPDLFDMLVVKLFTKLDLTCASTFKTKEEWEANVGYVRGLLVTVLTVLEEKTTKGHTDVPRYGVILCPRLFSLILSAATRDVEQDAQPPVAADPRVVRDIGRLLTLLVRGLNVEKQAELTTWMYSAFLEGRIGGSATSSTTDTAFEPLRSTASPAERQTMYAFAAVFVTLKKQVPPPSGDVSEWLNQVLSYTLDARSELEADAGYSILATTISKHLVEPVPAAVNSFLETLWTREVMSSRDAGRRSRAIRAWLWIAKAFIVRNSPMGQTMLNSLLETLFNDENAQVAKEAARSIGLVAKAEDGILSKDNGSVIRLLYRQKFFSFLLPKIISGYKAATPAGSAGSTKPPSQHLQSVYLIALSSILPFMPRQTTTEKLDEIFPLLIRAIDLPDSQARSSAATTIALAAAIGKKERDAEIREGANRPEGLAKRAGSSLDLVQDHLNTLVDRLLTVAQPGVHSPPNVRVAALRCLATICRCVSFSNGIKGQQYKVLKRLNGPGMGVDDPKKEVRIQGVDCKAVWHAAG